MDRPRRPGCPAPAPPSGVRAGAVLASTVLASAVLASAVLASAVLFSTAHADPSDEGGVAPAVESSPPLMSHVEVSEAARAHLAELVTAHPEGRGFIKVGDSATVSRTFLRCLATDDELDLGGREALRPALEALRRVDAGGSDPFRRESVAAGVGWRVHQVLSGSPPRLVSEVQAVRPRVALVLFGSNELTAENLDRYHRRMRRLTALLLERGVLPILHTLPARGDDPRADALVPVFNRSLRALAESERLPLIDLHGAFAGLPNRGLASDGLHPSAPVRGERAFGCDFSPAGLRHGQNARNLLTLHALDTLHVLPAE